MLRLTCVAFAGAIGGADALLLDAFTQPLGAPTAFARRQARNIQLVLMEESHLGRVTDPAAGAYYVETLTDELARAGWAFFQRIEAAGGLLAALRSGLVADAIAETRAQREHDIATRRTPLLGVSEFADLASAGVEIESVDPAAFARAPPFRAATGPDDACPPLSQWRAAEPFVALRARARRLASPRVYLATLGSARDHAARAAFARNLYAVGGMEAETGPPEDYDPAQTSVAVICGADTAYAEYGPSAVAILRGRGARFIALAGPPTAPLAVDGFIHLGCDATAALDAALSSIEAAR